MDGELGQTSAAVGEESHWIPLTDLMTGLMVIFLLIAVSYMMQVEADAARIKNVAVAYSEIKDALFEDLNKEFQSDLPKWKAQLLKTDLTIRFSEPEVLFAPGSSELKPEFQAILQDFFPRYVHILTSKKYRDSVSEVRIEGHTSSVWNGVASPDDAYFLNMELSQARTRSWLTGVRLSAAYASCMEWEGLCAKPTTTWPRVVSKDFTRPKPQLLCWQKAPGWRAKRVSARDRALGRGVRF